MIHYVNTAVDPAELLAAAQATGMTVPQFEAHAIVCAVEDFKSKRAIIQQPSSMISSSRAE